MPTIGVFVHYIGEHIPAEFIKDRKEGYLGIDISKTGMEPLYREHVEFVRAQVHWLKQALAKRPYVLGNALSAADLACWQTIFLLRKNCPPEVDALLGLTELDGWNQRILALGHGQPSAITAE